MRLFAERDERSVVPIRSLSAVALAIVLGSGFLAGGGSTALALMTDTEEVAATISTAADFDVRRYYLSNNPTPPTGDTNSQSNLGLSTTAPTATTLYNYDVDRDASPGRLLIRGASGPEETDLARYQNWRLAPALITSVDGNVTIEFWSAAVNFDPVAAAEVHVYLRDVDPILGTALEIGDASLPVSPWQAGSGAWVKHSATISVGNHAMLPGRQLELKLTVDGASETDLWIAYDTVDFPSRLTLP